MRRLAAIAGFFCLLALSASAQYTCINNTNPLWINCDTDVRRVAPNSAVLFRVWNDRADANDTAPGDAKERFVARDGSEARYQATHSGEWTAEIAAKNNVSDSNKNYLQLRVLNNKLGGEIDLADAARLTILGNGNVGIGTTDPLYKLQVDGNTRINGTLTGTNIAANYQDIAEWVPATQDLAPGTVVVVNAEATNQVVASSSAYDTRVAGVVSAQPGITLGVRGSDMEQVATTGRVMVFVDATNGAIHVGDLLVTSNLSGVAMRSEPLVIGGEKLHRPGTIIGKALQPLESGRGSILVLLSLQ